MEYINCKIGKDGLYMSSKTPQEGYVETKYGTNNENTTYKKSVSSVKGVVTSFLIEDITFDNRTLKFCKLSLLDGNTTSTVSVSVNSTYGNYTKEFTKLISALDGYKVGEEVTLTAKPNTYTNNKGEQKKDINIYINYVNILNDSGKGQSTGFIPFDTIPKPVAEQKRGETVYNWDSVMDFWYSKYEEVAKKIRANTNPASTASTPKPSKMEQSPIVETPSGAVAQPDPYDDLPF